MNSYSCAGICKILATVWLCFCLCQGKEGKRYREQNNDSKYGVTFDSSCFERINACSFTHIYMCFRINRNIFDRKNRYTSICVNYIISVYVNYIYMYTRPYTFHTLSVSLTCFRPLSVCENVLRVGATLNRLSVSRFDTKF